MISSSGRRYAWWAASAVALVVSPLVRGQEIKAVWDGRNLRIKAPKLHFLTGKPLENLGNGRAVPFDFHLSLASGGVAPRRVVERFVISYDLWEEKYAVTRLERRKEQSNLPREEAESWCLENLALSTEGLSPDRLVTVQLEIRAADARNSPPLLGEPGISLTALLEIFSRPARPQQAKWNLQEGPLRLSDVRVSAGKGQ
ncbi:MAG: hypothetical protein LC126_09090 [Bryobacterales bacterium]|nr:hypothetical protein [Bryobacterales bacterium]